MEYVQDKKEKTSMHPPSSVIIEFLWNEAMFELRINGDCLHLECIKSGKLVPLSSRNASIELHRIMATTCKKGHWMVDEQERPILNKSFFNFLKFKLIECFILTIHFWDKLPDGRRKYRTIDLCTSDEEHCQDWQKKIELSVCEAWKKNGKMRPQNLLVFVNPFGGKKIGEKFHREIVSPLFTVADIKETVIFTKSAGQAKEYLMSNDLSPYDGIIAMGGDGTFNEIANGVLQSTQKKHNVGLDRENGESFQKEIRFEKPTVRLGVIPVGTANMLSCTAMGVTDPETATIQIIAGESHPLDVCSMHNEQGKFVTFFFLGSSCGVIEKILTMSERYRFFGLFRYELSALNAILQLSSFFCEITYLPAGSNKTNEDFRAYKTTCKNQCPVCLKTTKIEQDEKQPLRSTAEKNSLVKLNRNGESNFNSETNAEICSKKAKSPCKLPTGEDKKCSRPTGDAISKENNWKVIQTPYVVATALNIACKYKDNPSGFSPSAHLADGTCDLKMIKSNSRMEFIRSYRAGRTAQGNCDFPGVEHHRVRAFHFQRLKQISNAWDTSKAASQSKDDEADDSKSEDIVLWTIDGEIMKNAAGNITVWSHHGLIDMFCTRD